MSDKLTDSEAPSENPTPSGEPHGDPLAEAALDDAATSEGAQASDPAAVAAEADAAPPEAAADEAEAKDEAPAADGAEEESAVAAEAEATVHAEAAAGSEASAADAEQEEPTAADGEAGEEKQGEEKKGAAKEAAAAVEGEEAAAEEEVEDTPEVAALREAKDNKTPVTGRVIGWNRGGFHIALEGFTAFCPNSEMEPGRPKDPATYLDKELTFRVIKVQKRGRRVVLSRAELAREERAAKAAETLKKLEPGAVLKGTVSSVTDFGAFVDLGGVEGLVHVSEISRSRVGHAREAVQVGKDVEVKVLKVEQGGKRISLSMKALEPNPWDGVAERFPRGSEFTGKVVRKTDFGLFVELEADVDGLVHLSRLPHGVEMNDESLEVGKEVKGWVQEVEPKRQRISLSLREIPKNDPWQDATEQFPEGEAVEGTVESLAPFGVFINLAPGLTGLLPASEMGLPKHSNPGRVYPPGQKVKVQVVSIDRRRKRISLAKEGSAVEGSRNDYQAYVKQQKEAEATGMSAMEAAFAKLKNKR
ncbi:MAG: S1 RNA-binding domain-containing protein [Acidobacteriota bacterium]